MAQLPSIGSDWHRGEAEDLTIIQDCYCPLCGGSNAVTTMLPTKVPAFREIIIMNLSCDDCGARTAEVNFGGEIQVQGQKLALRVQSLQDLNRQIVKSDSASIILPHLELEIPPQAQRGTISTLEGILERAAENLQALQPERLRLGDVDNFHRCRHVIEGLYRCVGKGDENDENENDDDDDEDQNDAATTTTLPPLSFVPFELIVDDPAGNSYIENPLAPAKDPQLTVQSYYRTATQDLALGLQPSAQAVADGTVDDSNPHHKNPVNAAAGSITQQNNNNNTTDKENPTATAESNNNNNNNNVGRQEVMIFDSTCPSCHHPTETKMCVTDIPHFKEVIIMSLLCDHCGYKSNEIKGGGAIPKYGNKITLCLATTDDLAREILKSDTAGINIPELELELDEGGLDGLYTTVEGLLQKMHERLTMANPFGSGDSATKQHADNDGGTFSPASPNHVRYREFLQKLQAMAQGEILPFTLIVTDPLSNSFVGPPPKDAVALSLQAEKDGHNQCYDAYVDPGMVLEEFERTFEQNESLGLNDMKTENYRDDDNDGEASRPYYGTDQMEEVPDRIRRLDVRGPDHPHEVGKAPVEGDTTVMGANSLNFAVPAMGQRGKHVATPANAETEPDLLPQIRDWELQDEHFCPSVVYDGAREGLVFKMGALGLGYYSNTPLDQR